MIKRYLGVSIIAASMLAMGCSSSDDPADPVPDPTPSTYTAPASATGDLDQAVSAEWFTALGNAGITDFGTGNTTVFVPSTAALAAAQEAGGLLDPNLPEADRQAVLQFHMADGVHAVAPGETGATQMAAGELTMRNGLTATIAGDAAAGFTFAGAALTATDVYASNGVVHEIDAVVDPALGTDPNPEPAPTTDGGTPAEGSDCVQTAPTAGTQYNAIASDTNLSSFRALLQDTAYDQFCNNLNEPANGPWTVFAPTNAALAAYAGTIDGNTIRAHIYTNGSLVDGAALAAQGNTQVGLTNAVNGVLTVTETPLSINGFAITQSIVTDNGTVHVIEGVIP